MRIYTKLFDKIASAENLFSAWDEFKRGKGRKADVAEFELHLEQHIFNLRRDLLSRKYRHESYSGFYICDPKVRHIHKATVRDRVLHHAIFRVLNPVFEPTFIPTSFSCRIGKGNHKGMRTLAEMLRAESRNNTRPCFVLKCDIRKFFDSIDHNTLLDILSRRIRDKDVMWLLQEVVRSYSVGSLLERKGVPIGNLTSQLFANIYLNELDQFVKHALKVRHYARYTDDFVIVSGDDAYLQGLLPLIHAFLRDTLDLGLHPEKVIIRRYKRGIDFLGYIALPHRTALRTKTKRRMFRKLKERVIQFKGGLISEDTLMASLRSYIGVLSHAAAYELEQALVNQFWFWMRK